MVRGIPTLLRDSLPYALCAAAFLYASQHAAASLIQMWLSRADYSHGFIVPLISIALAWSKREELRSISVRPEILAGSAIMLVGGIVLWTGTATGLSKINGIALLLMIPGLILTLFGRGFVIALAFPLLYLLFMVPLFDYVIELIYRPFQLFSAASAALLLQLARVPVSHQGEFLSLPSITLEVARECSGVGYLLSIIAVGVPLAYYSQRTPLKRLMLVAAAAAIGVVANGVRVFLIGLWVHFGPGGPGIHGPRHMLHGYFVAVCGFVFLLLAAWALNRHPGRSRPASPAPPARAAVSGTDEPRKRAALSVAVAVLAVFGAGNLLFSPKQTAPVNLSDAVPLTFGSWRGVDAALPGGLIKPEKVDGEVSRTYRKPFGRTAGLYIGYTREQRDGDNLLTFTFGKAAASAAKTIAGPRHERIQISEAVHAVNGRRFLVYSWFALGERIVSGKWALRMATVYEALVRRSTQGAFVVIASELDGASAEGAVVSDMTELAGEIMTRLDENIFYRFPEAGETLQTDGSEGGDFRSFSKKGGE